LLQIKLLAIELGIIITSRELTTCILDAEVAVQFNVPPDTIYVISETVFTPNHLTDTDKQNRTGKTH